METEAILNRAFIFDPTLNFFKDVRALDMETKCNLPELVETTPYAAAMVLLMGDVPQTSFNRSTRSTVAPNVS